jgi:hypothetical protein
VADGVAFPGEVFLCHAFSPSSEVVVRCHAVCVFGYAPKKAKLGFFFETMKFLPNDFAFLPICTTFGELCNVGRD